MEPTWLRFAYEEMRKGVIETPGKPSNPRIVEYHSTTALKATSDEVPWCSAFVCWCLEKALVASTASARARSYLEWGVPVSVVHPPIGAVIILTRSGRGQPGPEVLDAPGHVGFFYGHAEPGRLLILAGNQDNRVGVGSFPVTQLLGARWTSQGGK